MISWNWNLSFLVACLALSACSEWPLDRPSKQIIGRIENVVVDDSFELKSRIDTGAGVSSLDATIVKIKPAGDKRNKEHVVFQISSETGEVQTIEREIIKWQKIKGKENDVAARRPVVILTVCLGGQKIVGRFNLADRENFLYPVLIGRNILKSGNFLIDPSKKFTSHPRCAASVE